VNRNAKKPSSRTRAAQSMAHPPSARHRDQRTGMGITQQQIADDLRISIITVHRALNNSGYVSKELRARILAYAKEARYVPHKASQVLKRNRVRKIAVFSSSLPHYFWKDIRTGITIGAEQIQPFNYRVNYHMIAERDSRLYFEKLREEIGDGVEAVAFVNQWIYDMNGIISFIDDAGIPYVTLNVDAPDSRRICYIGPDYRAGGRLAAEYIGKTLLFKKHARVLVLTTRAEVPAGSHAPDINQLRYEGFRAVLQKHFTRIEHEVALITGKMHSRTAAQKIEKLLISRTGRFDAIYLIPAYNAQFIEALEKTGSEDRVIVLHDLDSSSNHYLEKSLLTAVVYQNPILQGYYAVKILENLLESGHPPDVKQITIIHSLILNENRDLYKNHYLFARMIE
jgi:LacI family transcriptional regulator